MTTLAAPSPSLTPAQRSKIRRLSQPGEAAAGEESGEINVVPYLDIITNVMMFVLVSVAVTFTATIPTSASTIGPRPAAPAPAALHLTALVTPEGVALTTASGAVAPGCDAVGAGITVPSARGHYDFDALRACARKIKESSTAAADERQVAISASAGVPYEVLVAVMDALRSDERGELFPDARLGIVR